MQNPIFELLSTDQALATQIGFILKQNEVGIPYYMLDISYTFKCKPLIVDNVKCKAQHAHFSVYSEQSKDEKAMPHLSCYHLTIYFQPQKTDKTFVIIHAYFDRSNNLLLIRASDEKNQTIVLTETQKHDFKKIAGMQQRTLGPITQEIANKRSDIHKKLENLATQAEDFTRNLSEKKQKNQVKLNLYKQYSQCLAKIIAFEKELFQYSVTNNQSKIALLKSMQMNCQATITEIEKLTIEKSTFKQPKNTMSEITEQVVVNRPEKIIQEAEIDAAKTNKNTYRNRLKTINKRLKDNEAKKTENRGLYLINKFNLLTQKISVSQSSNQTQLLEFYSMLNEVQKEARIYLNLFAGKIEQEQFQQLCTITDRLESSVLIKAIENDSYPTLKYLLDNHRGNYCLQAIHLKSLVRNKSITVLSPAIGIIYDKASHSKHKMLEYVLGLNVEPDAAYHMSTATLLMQAAKDGDLETVQLLLASGADYNHQTDNRNLKMMTGFVTDPNQRYANKMKESTSSLLKELQADDYKKRTVLHEACIIRNNHVVKYLLENCPDIKTNIYDYLGYTAYAAYCRDNDNLGANEDPIDAEIIDLFLARPECSIDQPSCFDQGILTTLYCACEQGKLDLVKILLERGANINYQRAEKFAYASPLYCAYYKLHEPIFDLLLQNMKLSVTEKDIENIKAFPIISDLQTKMLAKLHTYLYEHDQFEFAKSLMENEFVTTSYDKFQAAWNEEKQKAFEAHERSARDNSVKENNVVSKIKRLHPR